MASPPRRSGRARVPNKKYSIDPFDDLPVNLYASSDSGSATESDEKEDPDADEEFDIQKEVTVEDHDDELLLSGAEEELDEDNALAQDDYTGEALLDDDASIIESHDGRAKGQVRGPNKSIPMFGLNTGRNQKPRLRAIVDVTHHGAKDARTVVYFGPSSEDLAPIIRTRDKWYDQATLPSHKPDEHGVGGFEWSFSYPKEQRQKEEAQGWTWYDVQGGKETFQNKQIQKVLPPEDGQKYLPSATHKFVMGPFSKQSLFQLRPQCSIRIADAFPAASQTKGKSRNGWILNAGGKPQWMEWVPNKPDGAQYLAVATELEDKTPSSTSSEPKGAPAFTPSPPTPSQLQIWSFQPSNDTTSEAGLEPTSAPRLEAVFCFDWGPLKQFKFCPLPRKLKDDTHIQLGLVSGIWDDGFVRVLSLSYPKPAPTARQPHFIHITTAAFFSRPVSTLCTSLTWLSSSSLAAGCSNGCVAIWNLPTSLKSLPDTNTTGFRPWFYQSFHVTYILNITSCWPSKPHFLITSSMDGYQRLTDMRCPTMDFALSKRARNANGTGTWWDHGQSLLKVDENFGIQTMSLRRFHGAVYQARAHSQVIMMAVSLVHPITLAGCADGSVISFNPLRRMLAHKVEGFVQTWFWHEWRRGRKDAAAPEDRPASSGSGAQPASPNSAKRALLEQPMSRITEGYKLEKVLGVGLDGQLENNEEGVMYTTIYEEKSAITALCWNQNLKYGGWAAAGMGSGLVRIEDIAI